MSSLAIAGASRAAHTSPVTADKAEGDAPKQTSLAVRLGTIGLVGGAITGLSALVGVKSVVKAQALKGGIVGGVVGAVASAAIIAATGLATRSGGTFGSGAAGSAIGGAGALSGSPSSG